VKERIQDDGPTANGTRRDGSNRGGACRTTNFSNLGIVELRVKEEKGTRPLAEKRSASKGREETTVMTSLPKGGVRSSGNGLWF